MQTQIERLNAFFARPLCVQAARPLARSARLRLYLGDENYLLEKKDNQLQAREPEPSESPDLSFRVPQEAMDQLYSDDSKELGELAVRLLKLMATSDPKLKIRPSIHIGVLDFMLKGYAGLVAAGGAPLMKYLATKGLGSIALIKNTLKSFRTEA